MNAAGKGMAHSGVAAGIGVLDAGRKGAASALHVGVGALHAGAGALHAGTGAVAMGRQLLRPGQPSFGHRQGPSRVSFRARRSATEVSTTRAVVREQGTFRDLQALDRAVRNWADLVGEQYSDPVVTRIADRIPAFRK